MFPLHHVALLTASVALACLVSLSPHVLCLMRDSDIASILLAASYAISNLHCPPQEGHRAVTKEQGHDFARTNGCLYVETSAKANIAVSQAFEELVLKILETPALMDPLGGPGLKLNQPSTQQASTCSC